MKLGIENLVLFKMKQKGQLVFQIKMIIMLEKEGRVYQDQDKNQVLFFKTKS